MSDIKQKLDRLKKERETRAKTRVRFGTESGVIEVEEPIEGAGRERHKPAATLSEAVERSWERIEKEKDLSTKEKLEQLLSLTGNREKPKRRRSPVLEKTPREGLEFIENPYPLQTSYGRITLEEGLGISGETLSCLSGDPAFNEENLDLSSALFIDLETTGLTGGTGVIPFNVGMGYYQEDRFIVAQFFLGEPAEEERMIEELGHLFESRGFRSVVTYNGKTFDLPLLETRFILHRRPFPLNGLPHLDFLFPARSLWKHKHESCRLFHLAREVVRTDRAEDIPSAEIPARYFQYVHTGNYDLIEPILYHNQEDILSLLGLVITGAQIFSQDPETCRADAMDFFGAGKILERRGDVEGSTSYFRRALDGGLSDEVSLSARRRLAAHYKRNQIWEPALDLWREMADTEQVSPDQLSSLRELAMYFEHKAVDFEQAIKVTEEGVVLSMGYSSAYEQDFRYRLERLKRKLSRHKVGK